jgi:hypothetical protein
VNSKQVLAAVSVVVLVFILVYPALSTGTLAVSIGSAKIQKADHVYVTVDSVWAHTSGGAWKLVSNSTEKVDLVSLENSTKLLGTGQIPTGTYDSVRIMVSNVTWVFNKTTTVIGIASPEIDGSLEFTVGASRATSILILVSSRQELIADSEYYTGTMNATVTS